MRLFMHACSEGITALSNAKLKSSSYSQQDIVASASERVTQK